MVPPSGAIGFTDKEFDADGYRAELRAMSDDELLREGKILHGLVYPRTVSLKPNVFDLKLPLAREEWSRRKKLGP